MTVFVFEILKSKHYKVKISIKILILIKQKTSSSLCTQNIKVKLFANHAFIKKYYVEATKDNIIHNFLIFNVFNGMYGNKQKA